MEQYHFSNSNIDSACEEVGSFLSKSGIERREVLRTKLTVEEVLLEYQARFGEEAAFRVRCINRFPAIKVEISVAGESFDPLDKESDENEVIRSLLERINLAPTWSYKNGRNYIIFIPKKKALSGTLKMVIAIVMAVVAGSILNLLPEGVAAGVNGYLLTPVTNAFMGLISAVSGPLIFFSVLGSILSMGNMETLGKIGIKTLRIILVYSVVIATAMTALGSLFYPVEQGGGGASNFSQVLDMVYAIIPGNLFEPFLTGNALQLIFISAMVGLAMLILSSRVSGVFSLVEQFSSIIQTIMSGLTSMLPALIFVLFTGMISSGNLDSVLNCWKLVLMTLLLICVYYVCNLLWISFRHKVSPALLLKKTWPTLMIALTTASSSAAFSTNVRDANKKFGIDSKLVAFGTPIGQVLFMPGFIALMFSMEASFAQSQGIPITVPWLIVSILINILVAFAVPPIPGGAIMGFTVAFTQLGIPLEVMGLAIAVDAFLDFPQTACNVSAWQLTLLDVADNLGMLDKETLYSKN